MIDLMLELAYVGSVGGLALNNISQVIFFSVAYVDLLVCRTRDTKV